jgi:hypothetical protein
MMAFCVRLLCRPRRRASSFSHSPAKASIRLATCERSRCMRTSTPVGLCRNHTVDEVLLIVWQILTDSFFARFRVGYTLGTLL